MPLVVCPTCDEDENLAPNAENGTFVFNAAAPFGAANVAQPAFAF